MLRILILLLIFTASNVCFGQKQNIELAGIPVNQDFKREVLKTSDKWLEKDKAKHFLASVIITGGSMWVAKHRWGRDRCYSRCFGMSFGISLGLAKEFMDKRGQAALFSWRDLAADFLGVIIGGLLLSW